MRRIVLPISLLLFLSCRSVDNAAIRREMSAPRGVLLEDLTWVEAERTLTAQTVVVLPLGAAAKEHGPHLKLKNDFILAEYFTKRIQERAPVVIAPAVTYHYYPA